MTAEPPPSPNYPDDWCFIHGIEEPFREGDYRVCGECWHVFRTPEELVAETAKYFDHPEAPPVPTADEIWTCPLCAHDF